jgi:hypothetical protein
MTGDRYDRAIEYWTRRLQQQLQALTALLEGKLPQQDAMHRLDRAEAEHATMLRSALLRQEIGYCELRLRTLHRLKERTSCQ